MYKAGSTAGTLEGVDKSLNDSFQKKISRHSDFTNFLIMVLIL